MFFIGQSASIAQRSGGYGANFSYKVLFSIVMVWMAFHTFLEKYMAGPIVEFKPGKNVPACSGGLSLPSWFTPMVLLGRPWWPPPWHQTRFLANPKPTVGLPPHVWWASQGLPRCWSSYWEDCASMELLMNFFLSSLSCWTGLGYSAQVSTGLHQV